MDGLIEFFVKRKAPLEIVRGIEFYLPDAASDRCERGLTLVGQGGQSNIICGQTRKKSGRTPLRQEAHTHARQANVLVKSYMFTHIGSHVYI